MNHNRGDWLQAALCAQYDPDWWFPDHERHIGPAIAICRQCPVIKQCRQAARSISPFDRYGVWAGKYYKGRKEQ